MKIVILDKGKDIMLKDTRRMDDLKKEIDECIAEISQQNDELEAKRNQPNNLFVASISVKTELKNYKQRLDLLKKKNTVTQYTFQRDQVLENILKERKTIGVLVEQPEMDKQRHSDLRQTITGKETYGHELQVQHTTLDNRGAILREDKLIEYDDRSKQTRDKQTTETKQTDEKKRPVSQQMCQPLIQRQKVFKNLNIDGQILSYAGSKQSGVGLYISNEKLSKGKYFEIKILGLGRNGSIAIGVLTSDYQENLLPGLEYSVGYHSDGKVLLNGNDKGGNGKSWSKGNRIRCEIIEGKEYYREIEFTHNGKKVYSSGLLPLYYHLAVGMMAKGDKVKVIF